MSGLPPVSGGNLLLILAVHLALTGLPAVAATLFAARRGISRVPVLLAIALAASGVTAMLAFWAYYAGHELGETYSYFLLFGSVLLVVASLYGGRIDRVLLRLATPLALSMLGSAFLVFLGFLHGGTDAPVAMSATRFSGQLPSDNDIPHFFAERFFTHGNHGPPPLYPPNWLASDRPPLQIGYVPSSAPSVGTTPASPTR